jgi:hypothetical protein
MKNIPVALRNYWFAEAPAERLAMLRIIMGLYSLWYLLPRYTMFMEISQTSLRSFEPVGVAAWLLEPLPVPVFQFLLLATLSANIAFLLGWRYRITGPLFALLLLFILCYRNSWSMIFHSDNVMVFHALILGFTPAANAYSLDMRKGARQPGSWLFGTANTGGWQYGWPIRLMCAVAAATYFLSGVAKLAGPTGLAWATGDVLRDQIAVDALRKIVLGSSASEAIYTLYNQSLLFMILGAGTLVIEIGAPFFLVNRRLSQVWAVLTFLMHWGIFVIMGITFRYQLSGALFAPYFEVEKIPQWLAQYTKQIHVFLAEKPGKAGTQVN